MPLGPRDGLILDPWDDDPTHPARAPRPRPPREPFRLTTRGLMIALAIGTVEAFVLVEAHRIGPGIEFTLFIAAVLGTLDFLVPGITSYLDRVNNAAPEQQTGALLGLGCLLVVVALLTVPVSMVLLLR